MKLRIRKNSLRFRLNRVDVEQLRNTGACGEVLSFGGDSQLVYIVEASSQCPSMQAEFSEDRIRVRIPIRLLQEWVDSDQVSLAHDGAIDGGPSLLVEKNLQCINCENRNPHEDEHSFPNPASAVHFG